ncbi:hypothetical protein AVO45_07790 [Ruegeria marisrubri]|uniref:Uncharacterized protein n=2 Tax=Ruegeria marisrubri TaxID=1685379 RepID=A0A0X3TQ39_9RHOB|nr:hypothetical protein AVO45_07790 [Ruegeria marisrubri]
MEARDDSGGMTEAGIMEKCAARYGKSIHTIRKIIDATTWVKGFYPKLIENPPELFPLTQALQLRTIHRLDPSVGKEISSDVFEGKFSGPQLADIVVELNKKYRPKPVAPDKLSPIEIKRRKAEALEEEVSNLLAQLLEGENFPSRPEVSSGRAVVPPCDFVVSVDGKPTIVAEVKNFSSKEPTTNLVSLLGNCALWQNQGFSPWLFFPSDAAPRIDKFQSMAIKCGVTPLEIFLVGDGKAKPWESTVTKD